MSQLSANPYFKTLGSDRVTHDGAFVTVYSVVDMPDWYKKTYRKTMIVYEEQKYFVAEKEMLPNQIYRYHLQPWPNDLNDFPGKVIEYNQIYVDARDYMLKKIERENQISLAMMPLMPFIGFLPSKIKLNFEEKYGIFADQATRYSLFLEYLALFLLGAMLVVALFTRAFDMAYLLAAIFFLMPDVIMRYSYSLDDTAPPYGLYEWLFNLRLK